jgi:hypothetical protein
MWIIKITHFLIFEISMTQEKTLLKHSSILTDVLEKYNDTVNISNNVKKDMFKRSFARN